MIKLLGISVLGLNIIGKNKYIKNRWKVLHNIQSLYSLSLQEMSHRYMLIYTFYNQANLLMKNNSIDCIKFNLKNILEYNDEQDEDSYAIWAQQKILIMDVNPLSLPKFINCFYNYH
jgi:hypothetical protein